MTSLRNFRADSDIHTDPASAGVLPSAWQVSGETHRLTDVLLCPPDHLSPVPCCSVTRERLRQGFATSKSRAIAQFEGLKHALEAEGVTCHVASPAEHLSDLCFMRDTAMMSPWGLIGLRPALSHRQAEADLVIDSATRIGVPLHSRICTGTIEGGDVCVARPGLLIVGCSGERTNEAGAEALSEVFTAGGWTVLICHFDPSFLHLDTMLCMLDERRALACVDVLNDDFLAAVRAQGIELLPVTYKEGRRLGCNVVSIDGLTVMIAAGCERVEAQLRSAGYRVVSLELDQFTACGGGVHCLTLPLHRQPLSDS